MYIMVCTIRRGHNVAPEASRQFLCMDEEKEEEKK